MIDLRRKVGDLDGREARLGEGAVVIVGDHGSILVGRGIVSLAEDM
jgi:hypothetical protein